MSGITPILDTLLHQVLGWQRDAPAARLLPARLIPPPHPAQPAPAAHSDSRLDPRVPVPTRQGVRAGAAGGTPGMPRHGIDISAPGAATVTRFTPAARVIADILARFPEAAAVIRAQSPLLDATERANPARLAAELRASIEASGLFYEAHLQRWRAGTFDLARLAREPQMRQAAAGARTPATIADRHADPQDGGRAPTGSVLQAALGDGVTRAGFEPIVRQQLELLAVPVLRWEGEPWAGLFMALALQVPPRGHEPDGRHAPRNRSRPDSATWRSRLTLHVARLGAIEVELRLGTGWVIVDLCAAAPVAGRMHAGSELLRRRLHGAGFGRVALRIRTLTMDGNHG